MARRSKRGGERRYASTVNVGVVHVTMATFVPDNLRDTARMLHADGASRKKVHARSMPHGHRHDMAALLRYR